jgi:hypothetical protein
MGIQHTPPFMDVDNRITDVYHQSMQTVEETLLKLKETVCSWLTTLNIDFEPLKSMTIEHQEQMLSSLKAHTEDDGKEAKECTLLP